MTLQEALNASAVKDVENALLERNFTAGAVAMLHHTNGKKYFYDGTEHRFLSSPMIDTEIRQQLLESKEWLPL